MADPVTHAEVEDVLSSIRRLVSEDKRPVQTQKTASANDRLVLTPALRVEDTLEDQDDLDTLDEEILHEGAGDAGALDDEVLFDDPAHDYAADPYNFSDDGDVDGEGNVLDALTSTPASDEVEDDSLDASDADAKLSERKAADNEPSNPATLSAKIEAMETAIGKIADTWEPDTPGADEYSGTDAPAMAWEDDVQRDATGAPFAQEDAEPLAQEDQFEDDKNSIAPVSDTDEAEDEASESEPTVADSETHSPSEEDSFAFGADDQLIDEEALRDLISDIVRSELQGALGERITRNVRKLVRREIHRALTAQELE